ncbi:MAG: arginine--tRNA ligase, partial [Clostridia bacterium]|nr:arginine--tRNA ligase [Clostridia bacterium]
MTTVQIAEQQLRACITAALTAAVAAGELPEAELPAYKVEIPADRKNGDLSVNVAMVSARALRKAPRQIADALAAHFDLAGTYLEKAEVAGPGFINFFLSPAYYGAAVAEVLQKGDAYGRSDYGKGEKVMVEFVSANPTGPMHMGNARGGALGDCLSAIMDAAGYDVWREFYVNDAGNQIEKFGLSLDIRYQQIFRGEDAVELPEDSYHGDDIKERAAAFAEVHGDTYLEKPEAERRAALVAFALPLNIDKMHADLEKYRIVYDKWFNESEIHKSGELQEIIDILTQKGLTYEKEGALWYKNAEVLTAKLLAEGKSQADIDKLELKDDVLVRQNGNPTYFTADIAYHRNK